MMNLKHYWKFIIDYKNKLVNGKVNWIIYKVCKAEFLETPQVFNLPHNYSFGERIITWIFSYITVKITPKILSLILFTHTEQSKDTSKCI